jgi:hypothetical protein
MSSFLDNNSGPIVEVSENASIVFSGVQDEVGQIPDGNKGDITVSNNGNIWTLNDINENVNVITGTYSSKLNQALLIKARKDTAGTITKGQVVYITGSTGTHLTVELAQANAEATSAYTIGIAATTITGSNDGFVMQYGRLTALSTLPTATYTEGQALYLSETTAGGYRVGIPEAPNHGVLLGFVVRTSNGSAGEIDVRIQNYQELEELSDVYVNGSTVNDFLIKKATRWENITPTNVKTILAINNVDNTSDLNKPISTATQTALDTKIDKNSVITGATKTKITYDAKGLVTAGTDADIADISGLQTALNAKQATLVSGTNIKTIENQSLLGSGNIDLDKSDFGLGNVDNTSDANKPISTATQTALDNKVDKVVGKGLSTEDYTTVEKNKLAGIATGAEVNVNADWNAVSGDAEIFNKPTISGTNTGDQTSIVGITGTLTEFNTALTGADFATGGGTASGTNTGDQNLFSTIAVAGQSNVVADSISDTLTLVAGSNIVLTTNATNDEITIASTGGITEQDSIAYALIFG